jgi:hypothetical protein
VIPISAGIEACLAPNGRTNAQDVAFIMIRMRGPGSSIMSAAFGMDDEPPSACRAPRLHKRPASRSVPIANWDGSLAEKPTIVVSRIRLALHVHREQAVSHITRPRSRRSRHGPFPPRREHDKARLFAGWSGAPAHASIPSDTSVALKALRSNLEISTPLTRPASRCAPSAVGDGCAPGESSGTRAGAVNRHHARFAGTKSASKKGFSGDARAVGERSRDPPSQRRGLTGSAILPRQ